MATQVSPRGQPKFEPTWQPRAEQVPPPRTSLVRHTALRPLQDESEEQAAPTFPSTYSVGQGELEPQLPPPRRPPLGPCEGDQESTVWLVQAGGKYNLSDVAARLGEPERRHAEREIEERRHLFVGELFEDSKRERHALIRP